MKRYRIALLLLLLGVASYIGAWVVYLRDSCANGLVGCLYNSAAACDQVACVNNILRMIRLVLSYVGLLLIVTSFFYFFRAYRHNSKRKILNK